MKNVVSRGPIREPEARVMLQARGRRERNLPGEHCAVWAITGLTYLQIAGYFFHKSATTIILF